MPTPLHSLLLRSLKYPNPASFDANDPAGYQALVVWLENTRVRLYTPDQRKELGSKDPVQWEAALRKYLSDLDCPLPLHGPTDPAALRWLLAHAVSEAYNDREEGEGSPQQLSELAQQLAREAAAPEAWAAPPPPPLPDACDADVRAQLSRLQQLLCGPGGDGGEGASQEATSEGLLQAHAMLETCVLPSLAELARRQQPAGTSAAAAATPTDAASEPGAAAAARHAAVAAMLAQYPLGFSTGDGGADLAATILRMLYIKDLRALQTLVDSAIVQVQEFTADPRTDAALGKVGR